MFSAKSPLRIFAFSTIASLVIGYFTIAYLGVSSLSILLILLVIEITFSFENAIINAKVLAGLSKFWQNMFLTIGIVIAIFGMRIIFPIAIVALTTGLPWKTVLDLALNSPEQYASYLDTAYPAIAGFGGAFLLMLAAHFFLDKKRSALWIKPIEKRLQKLDFAFMPTIITASALVLIALIPSNQHPKETLMAGSVGILTYLAINGLSEFFGKLQKTSKPKNTKKIVAKVGLAGFLSFMYLELLDASFSLDGVIGAFAITNQVILIAAGLGIGAIWVRSMTVFMVRRGTLSSYKYLEHGAYYTVFVLAMTMLFSSILHIPEAVAGVLGIILIVSSIVSSKRA